MSNQIDEERIFHLAKEIPGDAAREEYLDQVCAGDRRLRERVEGLLEIHEKEQSFLKSKGGQESTSDWKEIGETTGQQIGRFKLLQEIGEGGFGLVFMAEQLRPVRRKVALKVIKPGMDTKAVVARFDAERQALAMMDHPNIAKVLDGGATESGRPYFVMELVKGVPLTEYCDQNQLPTNERLALFVTVCQAVQHAHQKGIIHRDLKPSNILVTLHDGKPVIKVIDFGVAKAINQQLTEKTLFTAFGQMVGTPQYMSPEQAEISGLDVDTRSDVYSLGVLLYELLTSSTPLEAEQLRDVGYAEIQRLIKESDPLKPSTRLSTAGEKLTAIAQHRSVSPERLSALMRGDLDWVVMKALEKDRNRRYATPNDLGDDVGRYLAKEPVEAYPPSTAYRMRKFVKRNRNLVVGATAFTLMLVVLTIVAMSGWVSAMRQARVARDALYEQAIVAAMLGDKDAAEEAIANAEKAGVPAAKVDVARGLLAMSVGEYDDAAEKARKILNEDPDHISAQALLTIAAFWSGNVDDWSREFKKLKDFEPKTDVDRLITAHTVQFGDSERAVELLGQGRLKHSPIGLLITTIDRAVRSEENQRISEMVGVVEDYRYVKFLMPENKGVMAWRAAALAEAIATHHARGKNAEALELDGRKLLDQFPDDDESPFFNHARWGLCRVLGEEKGAAKALRLAGKSGAFCFLMASELIRQHKSLEAFDNAIVRDKDKYVRISRALLMDDPAAASEEIHRLWEEDKSSMNEFTCLFSIYALSLAGDVDGIRTLANNDLVPGRKNRFETRLCLDFFADPTPSMQAKLEQAVVDRGYATSNAYLTVAMWNLANGRRDRALEYLEKSSKVIVVGHLGNELARSLYQRMKNDDDFPKQLDLKSDRK